MMNSFIKSVVFFAGIFLFLIIACILLPTTPRALTSGIFGKVIMDDLLRNANQPRIILVGGSNISQSINSQMIKDSLKLNPINTGVSIYLGLAYMADNTLKYVKHGDIIVVSPEYEQFFDRTAYGGDDLVITILDVAPKEIFGIQFQQLLNIIPHIPTYSFTKLKPSEYSFQTDTLGVYRRQAFNQYGDNIRQWELEHQTVSPGNPFPLDHDQFAIDLLYEFKLAAEKKGAKVFITFPALQRATFESRITGIKTIEKELKKKDFSFLGTPERYIMPDSLTYDNPYHFIKAGVDLRTTLLVQDLKSALTR